MQILVGELPEIFKSILNESEKRPERKFYTFYMEFDDEEVEGYLWMEWLLVSTDNKHYTMLHFLRQCDWDKVY
jgi:hypothetical protein